jgi:flagellar biosynthetic protein FliR
MGIMSRAVPQMNILIVSFIINIVVGFLVFFITADEFFTVGIEMYADFLAQWFQAVS